jgi:hypothetical protein
MTRPGLRQQLPTQSHSTCHHTIGSTGILHPGNSPSHVAGRPLGTVKPSRPAISQPLRTSRSGFTHFSMRPTFTTYAMCQLRIVSVPNLAIYACIDRGLPTDVASGVLDAPVHNALSVMIAPLITSSCILHGPTWHLLIIKKPHSYARAGTYITASGCKPL